MNRSTNHNRRFQRTHFLVVEHVDKNKTIQNRTHGMNIENSSELDKLDLMEHPLISAEYVFFLSMDFYKKLTMLGHKTSSNKFQRIERVCIRLGLFHP